MLLIIMALGLISCSKKDENYYLTHPDALQKALEQCQKQTSITPSCQQLETTGKKMNDLARQLQTNPQAFGIKIVKLQHTILSQQEMIDKNNAPSELKASLSANKKELSDLLAIVKWLESPES